MSSPPNSEVWLIRHGQTAWSQTGQHTGRTDLPLTPHGEQLAASVHDHLASRPFTLVLTSPLSRARETCRIAGYSSAAVVEPDLAEWDYGELEGLTSAQIQQTHPSWSIWTGPWPGGETLDDVAARVRRVIKRCMEAHGSVALFAHGHVLRVLTACWLGLEPRDGRLFALDVASVSRLGWEHGVDPVIHTWNRTFEDTDTEKPSTTLHSPQ